MVNPSSLIPAIGPLCQEFAAFTCKGGELLPFALCITETVMFLNVFAHGTDRIRIRTVILPVIPLIFRMLKVNRNF